ncbi:MAG: Dam family site-specific DNA-(adenine-N6)-methyltransferase [Thermodesulfobacteriota bacterium]
MSKKMVNIRYKLLFQNNSKPFLRWPGGKRWLIPILKKELQEMPINKYIEPFLGGGAVFFSINKIPSILSDINEELVNTYIQIRDNPNGVVKELKTKPINKEYYNHVRRSKPKSRISQAVRFLYLNRTSFSGLYRLNKEGHFNVPYGGGKRTTGVLWRDGLINCAAKALENVRIICSDFEKVIDIASKGDFVYCDPTYTVKHNNNGFRRYNEQIFSWEDQKRLAICCQKAVERGATVVVSNAYHKEIRQIYPSFKAHEVKRLSLLSAMPQYRSNVKEYLLIGINPKNHLPIQDHFK